MDFDDPDIFPDPERDPDDFRCLGCERPIMRGRFCADCKEGK